MGNFSTKSLWLPALIWLGASAAAALFDFIDSLMFADVLFAEDLFDVFFSSPLAILASLLWLVAWGASIWFLIVLGNWKKAADANDVPGVNKLWLGNLLIIVGSVVSIIPVIGWILGPITALVGWVINLLGVIALKKSTTLHAGGVQGMNLIFIAIILSVAAGVLAFVPVLPGLLSLGAYVLQLLGWKKVAEA